MEFKGGQFNLLEIYILPYHTLLFLRRFGL